jgi:hypothetical protein
MRDIPKQIIAEALRNDGQLL